MNNVSFVIQAKHRTSFCCGFIGTQRQPCSLHLSNLFWVLFLASAWECFLLDSLLPFS